MGVFGCLENIGRFCDFQRKRKREKIGVRVVKGAFEFDGIYIGSGRLNRMGKIRLN